MSIPKKTNKQQYLKQNNQHLLPWIVWGLGCLFYFYENLIQVSLGVMSNEFMRDFAVTSHTLGIFAGVYFYFYAFMQLPSGIMIDYFGPKRLLIIATATCALSTIAFSLTDNFLAACIARLMIGFGSAFAVVSTLKLATNWFSADRFAFLTGLMVTIGMLGSITGEAPLALMVDHLGWRNSMMILGLFGIVLTLIIAMTISDAPQKTLNLEDNTTPEKEHVITNLKKLIKNKQLWFVALYGGLMYMTTPVFCGLWGPAFLTAKMHVSKTAAAGYISLAFIGWVIASPLWGIYSNRIGRRKDPMLIAAIGCLFSTLSFLYIPYSSPLIIMLSLFAFGVFSAAFLPAFSVAKELCNKEYVATGLSFMNMMNMIGIAIVNPIIGSILDRGWTGDVIDGAHIYSLSAYHVALSILPISIAFALLLLPFIRETHCVNVYEGSS